MFRSGGRVMYCSKCDREKPEDQFYVKDRKTRRRGGWCKRCLIDFQMQRWRDRKVKAVELMGGRCDKCGYDQNLAAMDFHHLDPREKEFQWNETCKLPWEKILNELKKCVLLCKNCHTENHCPNWDKSQLSVAYRHALRLNDHYRSSLKASGQCPVCDADVYGTKYCSPACAHKSQRKVLERPSKSQLLQMLETASRSAIARRYGVSESAVRKWLRSKDDLS